MYIFSLYLLITDNLLYSESNYIQVYNHYIGFSCSGGALRCVEKGALLNAFW
jgi:hypothetical protein